MDVLLDSPEPEKLTEDETEEESAILCVAQLECFFFHADFDRNKFVRKAGPGVKAKATFVRDEELELFEKFVSIGKIYLMHLTNPLGPQILALPPTTFNVRNPGQKSNAAVIVFYLEVFDILIRMMIGQSHGSLETTKFILRVRHAELDGNAAFYFSARSYKDMEKTALLNEILTMFKSDNKLSIDDSFVIKMHFFKK